MPIQKIKLQPEELFALWDDSVPLKTIGFLAGVKPTRVSQILQKWFPEELEMRRRTKHRILKEFTGTELELGVKEALRTYTKAEHVSISQFVAQAVEEKLAALGVEIHREPPYTSEPLPFEGDTHV